MADTGKHEYRTDDANGDMPSDDLLPQHIDKT